MKKQQYIGVCVVHPCDTEQCHRREGKSLSWVFYKFLFLFLHVINKPLERSYTGIKSLHVSSMNSTVCNTEPSCLLENSCFYLPNF